MIEAVEYACRQASEYAQSAGVFYCSAPETNGWEIMTAFGTVGATIAAVAFGIWSGREALLARRNDERARVEARLERYGAAVIDSIDPLTELATANIDLVRINVQKSVRPFLEALGEDTSSKREFGDRLSNLLLSVLAYLEQAQSSIDEVVPGILHRMIAANAQGVIRLGINSMCTAHAEADRQPVLSRFSSSADRIQNDIRALGGLF